MTGPVMWPRKLPASVLNDPRRKAEVRVYRALEAGLGPKWTVFYSRPWLGETATGAEIDGECDFVVAHPELGVLCIEVKGGGITYDPEADQHHSIDRDGLRHKIKNPVEQARRSKHELLRKAQAERGWPSVFVRFRHAVIFPDIPSVPQHLGADSPRDLFATRPDLTAIEAWIKQRLSGGTEQALGAPGIRVLENLLARPFQLHAPLALSAADDDEAIHELTPQQFHILTAFQEIRRVAVSGGAGTGKTVLACEDARRQAAVGRRTLITCGSPQLAQHIRASLIDTNVDVATFPELARRLGEEAGLLAHGQAPAANKTPELVFDSLSERPDLAYDAVIVDEAQDFSPSALVAVEALAGKPGATLHAYFDSNQRLFGDLITQLDSYTFAPIRLARNLRNTRNIHDATQRFYHGPPLIADGPQGAEVLWIEVDEQSIASKAVEEVRRLISTERVSPQDIALLVVSDPHAAPVLTALRHHIDAGLTIATITDFKGLERRFILVQATRDLSDSAEFAYVALSRARAHLIVVGSSGTIGWLRAP